MGLNRVGFQQSQSSSAVRVTSTLGIRILSMSRITHLLNIIGLIAIIALGYFFGYVGHVIFILPIVGVWFILTRLANLLIKKAGSRRVLSKVGLSLSILANLIMICLLSIAAYTHLEVGYWIKNNDGLMQLVREGDVLAAYKLGERKAVTAIPLLLETVDDRTKDINLRLNAIQALGRICSSSVPRTEHHEAVMYCLIEALKYTPKEEDKYIRLFSAEALGEIGDKRALGPLRAAVKNETDEYIRREMEKEIPKLVLTR